MNYGETCRIRTKVIHYIYEYFRKSINTRRLKLSGYICELNDPSLDD